MIYFLSSTKFPTTKAYGVTLRGTFEAALAEGFDARIVSPDNLMPNNRIAMIVLQLMKVLRKFYNARWSNLAKFAFIVHRKLYSSLISSEIKPSAGDLFWIRDLALAQTLNRKFPGHKVILELHQLSTDKKLKQISKLSPSVYLGPISESVFKQLNNYCSNQNIVFLPMGVADGFFSLEKSDESAVIFNIGYFGSYTSSGNRQGIDSALSQLVPKLLSDQEFRVHFAGIGSEGVKKLKRIVEVLKLQNQVQLTEYIDHSIVPKEMRKCKILLLPYPEGAYFESRFPIKALEYAAVKRPILCSRTKSHTNLFSDNQVWFYDPNSSSGILEVLNHISTCPELTEIKLQKAYEKAVQYTYKHRLARVIREIS